MPMRSLQGTTHLRNLAVLLLCALLGVADQEQRSTSMLTIPIAYSGGAAIAFEQDNPWVQAWGRFRTGNSSIDYVRPSGTGSDSLLLNLGQTTRPGRAWWRTVLDQYGSNDMLVPIVRLSHLTTGTTSAPVPVRKHSSAA